jgi:nucleoside-diphosphate-sugar epimerase
MPRPGSESVLLITGFPSFYARRMIDHILAVEPTSFLYILVDTARATEAQAYLAAMVAEKRSRAALLEGGSTSIDLGLSGAEFRQITREVDIIHHMVHTSDAGADKKTAEALNVVSAAEILEIARASSGLQCLTFHSTAGVSGERHGVVYEGDLDEGQAFRSAVAETRMRAEQLVQRAMRDVPIAVIRPTMVVGGALTPTTRPSALDLMGAAAREARPAGHAQTDGAAEPQGAPADGPLPDGSPAQEGDGASTTPTPVDAPADADASATPRYGEASREGRASRPTPPVIPPPPAGGGGSPFVLPPGETERLEGIYLLILLLIATPPDISIPMPGNSGDVPVHVVPIDYVVRAAHAIGRHPAAPGRTFHIADPSPPSARRVVEIVSRSGRKRAGRGYVPSDLAKTLLRTPGIERFVRRPRAFLEQLMLPVRYDTRNTEMVLAGTGLECPPFESYVDELIAAVEEHVRSRRERRASHAELEVDDPLS